MTDLRRVDDLSAGELLEAAGAALAALGVTRGHWTLEVFFDEGRVRQVRAALVEEQPRKVTIGGKRLREIGRSGEIGSAA